MYIVVKKKSTIDKSINKVCIGIEEVELDFTVVVTSVSIEGLGSARANVSYLVSGSAVIMEEHLFQYLQQEDIFKSAYLSLLEREDFSTAELVND